MTVMWFFTFFFLDHFGEHLVIISGVFFFFFKQKTAYEMRISDWSSDVCSSDLIPCPNDLISIRRTGQVIIILSVHPSGFHQKKGQQEEYMSAEMQPSPSVPDGTNMGRLLGTGVKRVHILGFR